jgi:hypothetical protein
MKRLIILFVLILSSSYALAISPGDFNGDGKVDIQDFGKFAQSFKKSLGDAGYNSAANLDGKGEVGLQDFGRFVQSFNKPEKFSKPRFLTESQGNGVVHVNLFEANQLFGSSMRLVPAEGVAINSVNSGEFLKRGIPDDLQVLGNDNDGTPIANPIILSATSEDGSVDVGISRVHSLQGVDSVISGVSGNGNLLVVNVNIKDDASDASKSNPFTIQNVVNSYSFKDPTELHVNVKDLVTHIFDGLTITETIEEIGERIFQGSTVVVE